MNIRNVPLTLGFFIVITTKFTKQTKKKPKSSPKPKILDGRQNLSKKPGYSSPSSLGFVWPSRQQSLWFWQPFLLHIVERFPWTDKRFSHERRDVAGNMPFFHCIFTSIDPYLLNWWMLADICLFFLVWPLRICKP